MSARTTRWAAVALGVLFIAPAGLRAQVHQQQHMQQHAQQMDQQIQRMDQMRERIHQLDHMLTLRMQQLRDQEHIRQHEQLREMCRALELMAGPMRQAMERTREMVHARLFQDAEMQGELERLRMHWTNMAGQMEAGLQIMEQLQKRLGGG